MHTIGRISLALNETATPEITENRESQQKNKETL
jgi:hypothetical protein